MDKRDVPHVLVGSGGDTPQLQTQTVRCSRCLACDATLALQPPPAFLLLPPSPHSSSSTALPCLPGDTCKPVPSPPSSTRLLKWCHFDCKCISVPLFCIFCKANVSIPISYNLIIRSGHPYQTFSKPGKVMKCLCRSMLVASGHVLFLLNTQ